ncbi:hypothetical protein GCM10023159_17320 [Brevibacterium yomogidense]
MDVWSHEDIRREPAVEDHPSAFLWKRAQSSTPGCTERDHDEPQGESRRQAVADGPIPWAPTLRSRVGLM